MTVAKKGYGFDRLIDDEDWAVRMTVAERGYGLDKLINDEDENVRKAVAKKGYGLDKLVNDEDLDVRQVVAEQGYGLDKLVNDGSSEIRELAKKLKNAKVYITERNFGTYNGNIYLYVWKNKYEIVSGCYEANSLEQWKEKCTEMLGEKTANIYYNKMKEIIEGA